MTVSRVLHGRKTKVNDETYARVLEAMRELDYVPVRTTVQNRHVETKAIGLVPSHLMVSRYKLDSGTYEGICERASDEGYDLLVMLRNESEWFANRHEMRFLDRRSDGFIFISPCQGEWETVFPALIKHGIPTVVCYRRDVPPEIAWVDAGNEAIVRSGVECLLRNGHERIAYVCGPDGPDQDKQLLSHVVQGRLNYDDLERRRYFERMMGSDALILRGCLSGWNFDSGILSALLDLNVTGVLCVNDMIASKLWQTAEAAGLNVPRDLSIIGVDYSPLAETQGLTTIEFGYDEIGRQAVAAWVKLNAGARPEECCTVVSSRLVERSSVGAPRD